MTFRVKKGSIRIKPSPKKRNPNVAISAPIRKLQPTRLQQQLKKFSSVKEATLFEMQQEYGGSMRHFGIDKIIENRFFPYLRRGVAIYIQAKEKKMVGRATESDRYYLSEDFDEHMRMWSGAFVTNFRGANKEQIEPYLYDFYSKLIEKLKEQRVITHPKRLFE
jgi:hypothetical protein